MNSTPDSDDFVDTDREALEAVARQHEALLRDVEAAKRMLGHPELEIRMAAKARIEEAERAVLVARRIARGDERGALLDDIEQTLGPNARRDIEEAIVARA